MAWNDKQYREYRIRHQYDISREGIVRAGAIYPDITIKQLQILWDESVKETLEHFNKPHIVDCGIKGTGYQMYLFEKKVDDYKKDTIEKRHNPAKDVISPRLPVKRSPG